MGNRKVKTKRSNRMAKVISKIENLALQHNNNIYVQSHAKANGSFFETLMDPKFKLARTPQSTTKTVVAKIVRNFTFTANTSGHVAFMFMPQAINDVNNAATGTCSFYVQNNASYTPTSAETTSGFSGINVGSIINNAFTAGRVLSAHIELMPNVSLTTAVGRGIIAVSKVTTAAVSAGPGQSLATNYARLQLQDVMLASPYVSMCEVSKMQGLCADWLPHESTDLLDYPLINFSGIDLSTRHPNENVVFGLFTGLPASAQVNVRTYINVELVPDSSNTNAGLFPLIAEFSPDRSQPLLQLRDAYVQKGNLCNILTMNSQ